MTPLLPLLAAAVLNAAPLTLDQALAEAESQSLELEAARARLQQAEQLSARAWAGYLPTLTVGGSYTRNNVEARIRQPTGYNIRDVGAPPSGTPGPYDPSQPASPQNPPGQPTSHILYPADYADIVIQPLDALGAQAQVSQAILAPA
ncbi:MAG: TolC family protein, partial [Myxococcaceae bacterium]|nr:TolC family protein [Myxococcaceae bacterium]